jgi:hypothetical protein
MSEPKFKAGDWAWSPFCGFQIINQTSFADYPIVHGRTEFTNCGRYGSNDAHPTLLTEAEANKLGYFRESENPDFLLEDVGE